MALMIRAEHIEKNVEKADNSIKRAAIAFDVQEDFFLD